MLAQQRLDEVRASAGAKGPLEAALQDAERHAGEPLSSLLIKPVQRLCKYPLLFRELLGAVREDDGAWPALSAAAEAVAEAAISVNERVRELEGMGLLRRLADALSDGALVTTSRSLLHTTCTL